MRVAKLSTIRNVLILLIGSADHITGLAGATLTITASKDGGAFASITPTVTDLGSGWYNLALTTTHTNTAGDLALHITATSADPQDVLIQVVAYDMTDATALGLSRIDALISSRMATYTQPSGFLAATFPGTVASTTNITAATGVVLSAAGVQAIWDALTSALTTVGSIGKRIADFLTGDSFVRLGAPAGASHAADVAAVKVDTAAVKVQTDKLTFTVANQIDANVLDWKSATAPAMTGDAFARLGTPVGASTAADVAAVKALLPAALVSGRIDASVGAMAAGVITSAAHAVGAVDAAALATDAGQEIADRILTRALGGGADTGRTVRQALAALRNKVEISGGTLTIYAEDDTTVLFSGPVTTTAGNPLTAFDPT